VGTKKKYSEPAKLTTQELQRIERLREHPELMERFQSIPEISANAPGPVKSPDEVEGLLSEEMRRLGNTTMGSWATSAEKRLAKQLVQQDASVCVRKKNADLVVCVWVGEGDGAGLADSGEAVSALAAGGNWRPSARSIRAFGAGADAGSVWAAGQLLV
jgi:hypothetical protein